MPVQHNVDVIKGMGWYNADTAVIADVEQPSDETHVPVALGELRERCASHPGSFVWIGLFEPTHDELAEVAEAFDLDQLLVDDAANPSQRAKIEFGDDDTVFALLKLLDYVEGTSDVETGQVAVFVGPWYAVTVRHGSLGDLAGVRARVAASPNLRAHGPYGVLYAVMDSAVDAYVIVMDEVSEDVAAVENEVFSDDASRLTPRRIYNLKRENQEIRRAVVPLVAPAHMFVNADFDGIPAGLSRYFRDIGEHILRVNDSVDNADNLLMTMLMASTSLQDLKQNRDMRKISAWVAIAAVPTAIAAIYGMNFDFMPELHQEWGYPVVLAVMGGICVLLFRAFKKSGWL
jgi:magnesium transporter